MICLTDMTWKHEDDIRYMFVECNKIIACFERNSTWLQTVAYGE